MEGNAVESPAQQLDRCLEVLRKAGVERPIPDLLWADLPWLLEDDAVVRLLVERVAALDAAALDADAAELRLLECLLDEARRAGEDARGTGRDLIDSARAGLESLDAEAVSDGGIVALGRAWYRAGLTVPAAIQSWQLARLASEQLAEGDDPGALAERLADSIEDLFDSVDGHLFSVYQALGDSLATLPDDVAEALVHEVVRWEGTHWQALAQYWLLDPRAAIGRAAAGALADLAGAGRLAHETASRLAWVRGLLPEGERLEGLDRALAEHRRRQRGWPEPLAAGGFDEARASVPDGAGAQYIALRTPGDHGTTWSMVLIKTGHGIRDAYVLHGLDADAQEQVWASLEGAADIRRIDREGVMALLAVALGESLANAAVPPPGLIEVAEVAGLTVLRPQQGGGRHWLDVIDPAGRLADLSPQERGRLINRGSDYHERLSVLASWFEDTEEATTLLEREPSPDKRERALRRYLEGRRDWWAELCLRSALVVPADEAGELRDSLAVTGLALLEGRELRRIPLMTGIVETTLAVHEPEGVEPDTPIELGHPFTAAASQGAEAEAAAIEALEDPGRPRLQPFFDHSRGLAEQSFGGYFGLHGYLFAVTTHPDLLVPSQWLDPLLDALSAGGGGFDSDSEARTVVGDMLELYNRINDTVLAGRPVLPEGCTVHSPPVANLGPKAPLGRWAAGFEFALERFGHCADSPLDLGDDPDTTREGLRIVTQLIGFLAWDPEAVEPDEEAPGSFEEMAALACESLPENQRLLCIARDAARHASPDPDAEADEWGLPDEGPPTPQAILDRLEDPEASYQWHAMDQAVAQAPAITPLLLERLRSAADDPEAALAHDHPGLLYAIVLLAYFGETAAHEPLLRLAALPEDLQEPLLGDAITELLPVVLWHTSGGETAGLKRVVADREAYGFGRGAAAEALGLGVLRDELDRGEISAYLASLLADEPLAPPGDPAWFGVIRALLELHPDEHEAVIRAHLRGPDSDVDGIRESDLDRALAEDREQALERYRRAARLRFPEDVHGYLSHWAGFQPRHPERPGDASDPFSPSYLDDPAYRGGGPPAPGSSGATKPRGPRQEKKKRKRKQQKKSRKANRKRR